MDIENIAVVGGDSANFFDCEARRADATAMHAAITMIMVEGMEKGFHYVALHLRVALLELEAHMVDQPKAVPAPLSDLPKAARRKPRISKQMRALIQGG
jgi:hypothetical protein